MNENMLKFVGNFIKEDHILIPRHIRRKLKNIRGVKVKILIEIPRENVKGIEKYSFSKVRNLLKNVKGNLSNDVIKDRAERI